MKRSVILILILLCSVPVLAQQSGEQDTTKSNVSVSKSGVIQLDALHLEAIIEKPSVSIMPKRIEPDLEEIEFILRKFDREMKMIPEELFQLESEKMRIQKIQDIELILNRKRE